MSNTVKLPKCGGWLILGLFVLGVSGFIVWAQRPPAKPPSKPVTSPDLLKLSSGFSALAQGLFPASVNITCKIRRETPQGVQEGGAAGSGFIVDKKNGYVITNAHVVEGATAVTVVLYDEREFPADIVGFDPKELGDIALLKMKNPPADLAEAVLGDSNKVKPGEWVIAIGNPRGLQNTLTVGVVSAVRELEPGDDPIMNIESTIQTDAAINPGNSGGPLYNLKGEVIGVNARIYTSGGWFGRAAFEGIGYAIPINTAKAIMEMILKEGKVTRPYLGLEGEEITERLARFYNYESKEALIKELKLKDDKGIFVTAQGIEPNSPAQQAGFTEGDVIIEIDGLKIEKTKHINRALAKARGKSSMKVKIIRNGAEQTLDVPVVIK